MDTLVSPTTGNVPVNVTVTDAGISGNLAAGTFVNFINPPLNVQTQAVVAVILSQGSDQESDEDKRARILLNRQNPPAGGNWSQVIEIAQASSTNASGFWVYPALGAPGATKVILTRSNAATPRDRTVDTAGIDAVINAFKQYLPVETQNFVVDTCANQDENIFYKAQLAASSGAYWSDGANAWPECPGYLTLVSGATYTFTTFEVTVGNSSHLAVGQVRQCAAWNASLSAFEHITLTMVSGSYPGPYTMTLSGSATTGSIICPWSPNINGYAAQLLVALQAMGPGEYLAGTHPRYPRAHRRPEPANSGPYVLNAVQSAQVQAAFSAEILQLDLQPDSTMTPAIPATVADKPAVIVPNSIAFFPGFP